MARIRTIKPEFWTDEKIVRLPFEARLMFIGLLNFADDDGRLWYEPDRLRLQIFPQDSFSIGNVLDLLSIEGMVNINELPDGKRYIEIPRFKTHQRISHPSQSRIESKGAKRLDMAVADRRVLAEKHGCAPGSASAISCSLCGGQGSVVWWARMDGKPSVWITSDLDFNGHGPICWPCNKKQRRIEQRDAEPEKPRAEKPEPAKELPKKAVYPKEADPDSKPKEEKPVEKPVEKQPQQTETQARTKTNQQMILEAFASNRGIDLTNLAIRDRFCKANAIAAVELDKLCGGNLQIALRSLGDIARYLDDLVKEGSITEWANLSAICNNWLKWKSVYDRRVGGQRG